MLLKGYRKEFVRPVCRPDAESVHVIAHLDQDIGEVLPTSMPHWEDSNTPKTRLRSRSRCTAN